MGKGWKVSWLWSCPCPRVFSPAGWSEPSFRAYWGTEPWIWGQEFPPSEAGQSVAHPTISRCPEHSFPLILLACAKGRLCELVRPSCCLSVPELGVGHTSVGPQRCCSLWDCACWAWHPVGSALTAVCTQHWTACAPHFCCHGLKGIIRTRMIKIQSSAFLYPNLSLHK